MQVMVDFNHLLNNENGIFGKKEEVDGLT